MIHIYKTKLI